MNLENKINEALSQLYKDLEIDSKHIITVPYGGANVVKKCLINNEYKIIKIYSKKYNFDLIEFCIKKLNSIGIQTIKINFYQNVCDLDIYIYDYIEGTHKFFYNEEEIEKVVSIIDYISKINVSEYKKSKETIYDKFNFYLNYFKNKNNYNNIDKALIFEILKIEKIIDYNKIKGKNVLTHSDLSPTNIIWHNNIPVLIDFDECCLAPKEYEYASFIIKSCFSNNNFNIPQAKKILAVIKKSEKALNMYKLKNAYYFYILKVLIEKLYYCENFGLDLESAEQQKDYWHWWYELLKNEKICAELFTNE